MTTNTLIAAGLLTLCGLAHAETPPLPNAADVTRLCIAAADMAREANRLGQAGVPTDAVMGRIDTGTELGLWTNISVGLAALEGQIGKSEWDSWRKTKVDCIEYMHATFEVRP